MTGPHSRGPPSTGWGARVNMWRNYIISALGGLEFPFHQQFNIFKNFIILVWRRSSKSSTGTQSCIKEGAYIVYGLCVIQPKLTYIHPLQQTGHCIIVHRPQLEQLHDWREDVFHFHDVRGKLRCSMVMGTISSPQLPHFRERDRNFASLSDVQIRDGNDHGHEHIFNVNLFREKSWLLNHGQPCPMYPGLNLQYKTSYRIMGICPATSFLIP